MTQELAEAVNHYKECVKKKAQDILTIHLPSAIVELNDITKKLNIDNGKEADVHQEFNILLPPEPQVNGLDELMSHSLKIETSSKNLSPIPCNKHVCDLINIIKPHVRRLLNYSNVLKMWLTYSIPKIEDGNNFGVEVQELIRDKIVLAEDSAVDFINMFGDYFWFRGRIISKVIKYPQVDDYRMAVTEYDERKYLQMWYVLSGVRNRFGILHDAISKNLDKIKTPRANNTDSLY